MRGSEGAYLCSRLYVWHCPPRLCFSDLRWVCSPRLFLLLFLMPASQPLSFSSCSSSSTPWPDPVPKDNHVPLALLGTARCGSPSQFSGPQGFCGEAPVASGPLETRFWKAARLWSVRRRSPLLGPQLTQRPRTAHRADLLILVLPLFPPLPPKWALPRVNPGKRLIKPGSWQPPAGALFCLSARSDGVL